MIGYYAHQHGSGHCNYAEIFSGIFKKEMAIFTSYKYDFSGKSKLIKLADENPDGSVFHQNQVSPPGYLHYSPVGQNSIRKRSLQLLQCIVAMEIDLLIVDVSAEIAALSRASSIPYAYVRLPGERNDLAHLEAFKGAVFTLAYFPESFEIPSTPQWLRKKTIYLGFLSRKIFSTNIEKAKTKIDKITVLSGKGGNENLQNSIPFLLDRFTEAQIALLGEYNETLENDRLDYNGFINDPETEIHNSDLVVANCGLNTVSELLQLQIPYVAIPEHRPFEEQEAMAEMLHRKGLALKLDQLSWLTDQEILNCKRIPVENETDKNLKLFKQLVKDERQAYPGIPELFRKKKEKSIYELQR